MKRQTDIWNCFERSLTHDYVRVEADHLGSSSFITDATGYATEHLQYLPYGELFVDQTPPHNDFETRYKFSGKELDPETNYSYFGARYYDSDLSVWLSVDPMSDKYPNMSPYNYCGNNPVVYFDPNGKYKIPTDKLEQYRKDYPNVMNYLESHQLRTDVMSCQKTLDAYSKVTNGNFTSDKVYEAMTMGSGPNFEIVDDPGEQIFSNGKAHGYYDDNTNTIQLNTADVKRAEAFLKSDAWDGEKQAGFMGVFMTILHETAEYGGTDQSSNTKPKAKNNSLSDEGREFENFVFGIDPQTYNAWNSDAHDITTARNLTTQQRHLNSCALPTILKKIVEGSQE